jgi:outer membrane lipoprotein-sorting protein
MVKRLNRSWVMSAAALLALAGVRATPAELVTPDSVVARGEERLRSLSDYECVVETSFRNGKKAEAGTARFWFKQPRMLRLNILRGNRKGSEVAIDRNGEIRGHKGGLLSSIVRRLEANDDRICNIRGAPVTELAWGAMYRRYRHSVGRPGARTLLTPRTDPNSPYELVVSYAEAGKPVREVYRVDPRLWVPVEGEVSEDNVQVEHVVFREIKLDTGIPENWFHL